MEIPAPADEATGGGAPRPARRRASRTSWSGSPANGSCPSWRSSSPATRCRPPGARGDPPRPSRCRPTVRRGSSCWPSQGGAGTGRPSQSREAVRAELRLLFAAVARRPARQRREPRAAARGGGARPTTRTGSRPRRRLAEFLGRTVAVSRPFVEAGCATGRRGRRAGDARSRRALLDPPRRCSARRACRPICCWATCATCRTACARPASCWRRSSSAGPRPRRERLATLRAVLGSASIGEAADRLGVHRNTVAYRVARLEAVGGWDLGDPELRFALGARRSDLCKMHKTEA